jgi:hypothetical protein
MRYVGVGGAGGAVRPQWCNVLTKSHTDPPSVYLVESCGQTDVQV